MLVIVVILAVPQLMKAWRYDPKAPESVAYHGVPLQTRLEYGGAYLALAALLAVMTYDVHEMLSRFKSPVVGTIEWERGDRCSASAATREHHRPRRA